MFNPGMMGMGAQLPDVPTVKELWKNEKSKYRHWVILFAIAILALTALSIVVLILNATKIDSIAQQIADYNNKGLAKPGETGFDSDKWTTIDQAHSMVITQILVPIGLQVVGFLVGIILFASTIQKAYKQQNFARISHWATLMVGIAAFMSFFNLIEMAWRGGIADYQMNDGIGIFSMVFNILSVIVWLLVSLPLGRIRRAFLISERVEQMKNDPQFIAMQQQMQAMMNGQPMAQGPFGPIAPQTPVGNGETVTPATPVENPEKKKLQSMSVADLKAVAKELSISGYEAMKKDELIETILRVTEGENKK